MMKALSLLQPWASLAAIGHKRIETRSRNTTYKGPLLIHASKPTAKVDRLGAEFAKHYHECGMWDIELPYGGIVGMVNLIYTYPTDFLTTVENLKCITLTDRFEMPGTLPDQERAFGDYSPGRWGWLLTKPVLFKEPIPAKGTIMPLIWTPDEATIEKVNQQIALSNE